jgi:hypothetical protein
MGSATSAVGYEKAFCSLSWDSSSSQKLKQQQPEGEGV